MEEHDWLTLFNDGTWHPDRDAWRSFPEWSQALDACHEQALDAQGRYWTTVQLKLAYALYAIGKDYDMYDSERIDAGERVARLAELLGKERVEALVQEVERAFAESGVGRADGGVRADRHDDQLQSRRPLPANLVFGTRNSSNCD